MARQSRRTASGVMRPRPRSAAAILAVTVAATLAALATVLLLPTASFAAVHPKRGDWEAQGSAGGVSFLVTRAKVRGHRVEVIRDFVAQDEVGCKGQAPGPGLFEPLELRLAVIRSDGRVSASRTKTKPGYTVTESLKGSFGSGHAGTLTFHQSTTGFAGKCHASERIHAHPGTRPRIRTGIWRGTAADGEPVAFGVGYGGRAIVSVKGIPDHWAFQFGAWTCTKGSSTCTGNDNCSDFTGDMFINPDGSFSYQYNGLPGNPFLVGTFTASHAASGDWREPDETDPSGNPCVAGWNAAPSGG